MFARSLHISRVGKHHIHTVYLRFFWQEITICTIIHGVNVWFWPFLHIPICRAAAEAAFCGVPTHPGVFSYKCANYCACLIRKFGVLLFWLCFLDYNLTVESK